MNYELNSSNSSNNIFKVELSSVPFQRKLLQPWSLAHRAVRRRSGRSASLPTADRVFFIAENTAWFHSPLRPPRLHCSSPILNDIRLPLPPTTARCLRTRMRLSTSSWRWWARTPMRSTFESRCLLRWASSRSPMQSGCVSPSLH